MPCAPTCVLDKNKNCCINCLPDTYHLSAGHLAIVCQTIRNMNRIICSQIIAINEKGD
jgi:hypothetical protein